MIIAKLQDQDFEKCITIALVPICPTEHIEKVVQDHTAHLRPAEWPKSIKILKMIILIGS